MHDWKEHPQKDGKPPRKRVIGSVFGMVLLAACSSVPVPQDQAQTVFALEGAYTTAAQGELSYINLVHPDAATLAIIKDADKAAYDAVSAAQKAVQSGDSAAIASAISAAQSAINALSKYSMKGQ